MSRQRSPPRNSSYKQRQDSFPEDLDFLTVPYQGIATHHLQTHRQGRKLSAIGHDLYPDGLLDTCSYLSNPFYARSKIESLTLVPPKLLHITEHRRVILWHTGWDHQGRSCLKKTEESCGIVRQLWEDVNQYFGHMDVLCRFNVCKETWRKASTSCYSTLNNLGKACWEFK